MEALGGALLPDHLVDGGAGEADRLLPQALLADEEADAGGEEESRRDRREAPRPFPLEQRLEAERRERGDEEARDVEVAASGRAPLLQGAPGDGRQRERERGEPGERPARDGDDGGEDEEAERKGPGEVDPGSGTAGREEDGPELASEGRGEVGPLPERGEAAVRPAQGLEDAGAEDEGEEGGRRHRPRGDERPDVETGAAPAPEAEGEEEPGEGDGHLLGEAGEGREEEDRGDEGRRPRGIGVDRPECEEEGEEREEGREEVELRADPEEGLARPGGEEEQGRPEDRRIAAHPEEAEEGAGEKGDERVEQNRDGRVAPRVPPAEREGLQPGAAEGDRAVEPADGRREEGGERALPGDGDEGEVVEEVEVPGGVRREDDDDRERRGEVDERPDDRVGASSAGGAVSGPHRRGPASRTGKGRRGPRTGGGGWSCGPCRRG